MKTIPVQHKSAIVGEALVNGPTIIKIEFYPEIRDKTFDNALAFGVSISSTLIIAQDNFVMPGEISEIHIINKKPK